MTVTTKFKASGLHCSSCSMLITMNLEDLDGVQTVTCDHATGLTQVTYDDAALSSDEIVSAIRAAGYDAERL